MNFLLVGIAFTVLAATAAGCALLGTDRLVPGRKTLEFIASDGLAPAEEGEFPLILSTHPKEEEIRRIRFATALGGYKKAEVDEVMRQLLAENRRLRSLTGQTPGPDASGSQPLEPGKPA